MSAWVGMEEHDIHHAVAVPKSQTVVAMDLRMPRAHQVIAGLPEGAWQRLSCGDGAHGPRMHDWARAEIRPWREPGKGHWLLARRSLTDPTDIAHYVCFAAEHTTLRELAGVAASRWAVEECFQVAKNETGLDHHQVRGYRAWYRHITLSMAALAFLVRLRQAVQKRGSEHAWGVCPAPASGNEIRRSFNRVTARIPHPVEHVPAWSLFRHRSQQRARMSHHRRRTDNNLSLQY